MRLIRDMRDMRDMRQTRQMGHGRAPVWSPTVTIDQRCTACGNCLVTCPTKALMVAPKRPRVIDDLCTGCGACIEVCPVDAIADARVIPLTDAARSDRRSL